MKNIEVRIEDTSNYTIEIGEGIFTNSLTKQLEGKNFFLCIDARVWLFHETLLRPFCDRAGDFMIIEAKEEYKTSETVDNIIKMLKKGEADRSTLLIAIGGGIIGDIVGYAAAIYMRGIPFIQVPTTLLSQVDSSIGGKVAVNYDSIKNMLGTFYSPKHVIIDIDFLETLTERLFKAGLVELLKHGFIYDKTIIDTVMLADSIEVLRQNHQLLLTLIGQSLEVKRMAVESDFHDRGLRHILNFGHTFAHALETSPAAHHYHGECVAIGILVMAQMSGNAPVFAAVKEVFTRFACIRDLAPVDFSKILFDKKRNQNQIKEVFLKEIGQVEIKAVDVAELVTNFETAYQTLQAMPTLPIVKPTYAFAPVSLKGTVTIPPSKSYAHRYLIGAALAALSGQETVLRNMYELADDVLVTAEAIKRLGVTVTHDKTAGLLTITPAPQGRNDDLTTVNLREAGTSLRLLLPVLTQQLGQVRLVGENKLPTRPMDVYFDTLTDFEFVKESSPANLPLVCKGKLAAGTYKLAGNVSSQFISGLMLVLPLLDGPSEIVLTTALESIPYVEMTRAVLEAFGIQMEVVDNYQKIVIPGNQQYQSVGVYDVEQDHSSRNFFEVAATFTEHDIKILPEAKATLQGDAIVQSILEQDAREIDLQDVPDTAPIMAVYFARNGGVLKNTQRLQFKESNRLQAILDFLTGMGINHCYDAIANTLTIVAGEIHGGTFNTYKDHRIAMALIIASTISTSPIVISEIKSITKSFSNFIEQYEKLGGFVDEK